MTTEVITAANVTNLADLIAALMEARIDARSHGHQPYTVNTGNIRVVLERETLTDGSHVLNVRLVPVPAEPVAVPPQPSRDIGLYMPGTLCAMALPHVESFGVFHKGAWLRSWGEFPSKDAAQDVIHNYYRDL